MSSMGTPRGGSFSQKIAELKAQKAGAVVQQATAPEAPQNNTEVPTENEPTYKANPVKPTGTLAERLAALRANQPKLTLVPNAPKEEPKDEGSAEEGTAHVPEVFDGNVVLSSEEIALDQEIAGINIIDAYNRWVGKGHVQHTMQKEGIKVRCPNPMHPDEGPSAWLNQEKGLWNCGGCEQGGDNWDFAAWHYGYSVPAYKQDARMFRELREKIAGELGYNKYTTSNGTILSRTPPTMDPDPEENFDSTEEVPPPSVAKSNVVQLHVVEDEEYAAAVGAAVPSIDWRALVSPNTFLSAWMEETTKDTCPEEFHFWTGLMALGFAVGRNRVLLDNPKVVPDIFVCLTGPSGTGKSRAKSHLKNILVQAIPFDTNDPLPVGTKLGGSPGSGEVLVDTFVHKIEDPSVTGQPQKDWPIRVYLEFDEMASLISRGARVGSTIKTQLMEVYDAPYSISAPSRGSGHVVALQPYGQVLTTTQNRSIREVVGAKDDAAGFINRWVFVTGPRKPQKAINLHVTDYTEPAKYLKGVHHWAMTPRDVNFTPEALKMFELFYEEVFAMKDKAEESTAIFNRIDLLLKKLILLLAINDKAEVIDTAHVEKLKALYPYLIETYGVVKSAMASTESQDLEQKIHGAVTRYYDKHKKSIAIGYISKLVKGVESELMLKTINNMIKLEMLIAEEPLAGSRGRPTKKLLPGRAA